MDKVPIDGMMVVTTHLCMRVDGGGYCVGCKLACTGAGMGMGWVGRERCILRFINGRYIDCNIRYRRQGLCVMR